MEQNEVVIKLVTLEVKLQGLETRVSELIPDIKRLIGNLDTKSNDAANNIHNLELEIQPITSEQKNASRDIEKLKLGIQPMVKCESASERFCKLESDIQAVVHNHKVRKHLMFTFTSAATIAIISSIVAVVLQIFS